MKLYKSVSGEVFREPPTEQDYWTFKIEPEPDKPKDIVTKFIREIYTDVSEIHNAIKLLRKVLRDHAPGTYGKPVYLFFIHVCLPPHSQTVPTDNMDALKALYKVHAFDIGSTADKEAIPDVRKVMVDNGVPVRVRLAFSPPKLPDPITCIGLNVR